MLVEINLLNEKNKKDVTYWLIASIIAFILLVSLLSFNFISDRVQNEIDLLEAERLTVVEEITLIQQQLEEQPISHFELLKALVENTEQSVIPASELLAELVRLLPEHGYMLEFDFYHPDEVVIFARFDQISSVAAYSYSIQQSPYVSGVTLYSVTSEFLEPTIENVLPRYDAHFHLSINRDAFHDVKEDN